MLKKDLILRNPLRALEPDAGLNTAPHRMGLVIARAGVGKTALLVQIALDSMLRGNKVVHVTIGQSLEKTKAWYDDLFKTIARDYQLEKATEVYESIMRTRMIMTFNATAFSGPKLEERLNDLVYQNIFMPDCLVIDGFDFNTADEKRVQEIRELMLAMNLHVWFSAIRRREDPTVNETGIPAPCHRVDGFFDTVILLEPEKNGIALNIIKDEGRDRTPARTLLLDPSTFLVKEG